MLHVWLFKVEFCYFFFLSLVAGLGVILATFKLVVCVRFTLLFIRINNAKATYWENSKDVIDDGTKMKEPRRKKNTTCLKESRNKQNMQLNLRHRNMCRMKQWHRCGIWYLWTTTFRWKQCKGRRMLWQIVLHTITIKMTNFAIFFPIERHGTAHCCRWMTQMAYFPSTLRTFNLICQLCNCCVWRSFNLVVICISLWELPIFFFSFLSLSRFQQLVFVAV